MYKISKNISTTSMHNFNTYKQNSLTLVSEKSRKANQDQRVGQLIMSESMVGRTAGEHREVTNG